MYKGRRKFTGQITAMKFIMKHGKSEKDIKNLRQEIEILRNLRHENIIQMLDAFETKTDFCVVTEFAHGMVVLVPCIHAYNFSSRLCNCRASPESCADLHQHASLNTTVIMFQVNCLRSWRMIRVCPKLQCKVLPSNLCGHCITFTAIVSFIVT